MSLVNHADEVVSEAKVAELTPKTAAKVYFSSGKEITNFKRIKTKHDFLKGYEVDFNGQMVDKQVDVKVSTGRYDNKGPVTMQVYTPIGKLKYLN